MDPLQWMGAVSMRVQTAEKKHHNNPQVIRTIPVQQLTSWVLVVNKSIIKTFLISKRCFQLKYEGSSIRSLSPVKKSSKSEEKYEQILHHLQAKMVLNKYIGGSWCEGTTGDIFTGGNVMDSYFGQKQQCKFKTSLLWNCFLQTCSFSLHNKWTDGLEWCGLLIQTAPIHCRGWRNKTIYILDGLRVSNFQLILFFGWTKKELIYSPSFLSTQHHRSNFF